MKTFQTAPSTQVQNNFGTYAAKVIETSQPLLVERHGHPIVVIMSYDTWQNLSTQTSTESAWVNKCRKFTAKVKKKFPKQTSSVKLLRTVREED